VREALAFLTVLGRSGAPSPRAVRWFPVVGTLLGAGLGLLWWGAAWLWPPLVAASVVVAADLAATGLLHLDGLADAADGLLAPLDRERRLAVMHAPEVGAFGVGVVVVVLLLRVASVAALDPGVGTVGLLVGLWTVSRTAMAVTVATVPYARPGGLASAFVGATPGGPLVGGVVLALAAALAGPGWAGVAAVVAAGAGATVVVGLARRRLGGFTGDVLGASGLVAETVGLVVAAGRW
jgi:adenosylcobinamide-GDP ribazoletransferase